MLSNVTILKFGCFSTLPSCGTNSAVNNLIKVDLPAPFGPKIATLDDNDNEHETFFKDGLSAPG